MKTGLNVKRTRLALIRFPKTLSRALFGAVMVALFPPALLPAVAQNEEEPRWFGGVYDNTTILAYGVPDNDYVLLSFSCDTGKPLVNVYIQDEASSVVEGTLLPVQLSAGEGRIAFFEKAIANENSGGMDVVGHLPLDDTLRHMLIATGTLEVAVNGHMQRYPMDGAAEPVAAMIAACDTLRPASDLDVRVTNKARKPLQSVAYSEAGVSFFDSDAFGYEPLEPGASRAFTIPGGHEICTFDLSVTFVDEDEECCGDGEPAGTRNLCENSKLVVHDQVPSGLARQHFPRPRGSK